MEQEVTGLSGGGMGSEPRYEALALRTRRDQLSNFFPLLQRGVTMTAVVGCPLRDFLCRQLAIPAEYVSGRITTIFLDNRPLDDLDSSIGEGARITLSAAMPGLVGAVMRRSSFYAALRAGITHAESAARHRKESGTVRLKLFNLLLPELGPLILARGILLERSEVNAVLRRLSALWMASYPSADEESDRVLLTVSFTD